MEATALGLHPRGGDPLIIAAPSFQPSTTPALAANLVFRVLLGVLANLVCVVPLRLLHRNGELAAVVFIVNIELKNIQTVLYALIWRNDDMENWWPGYGLCDLSSFFHNFSIALFVTCMLAITRNLAHQVGLMRANPLTVKEKRRRNLVQVLIMFPLPLVQLGLTWFLTAQRYAVGTLIGCSWVGYASWQYLVFFILAPVVVSLVTVGYAVLTYFRFREVAKTTESALSSNRVANYRAQRARRRLYLMIVSIMVPFFPVIVALCVLNIRDMGPLKPYDYDKIHEDAQPYPWNSIMYLPSSMIAFPLMNIGYIPILTSIPVFVFFGMTKDAMNDYRKVLLFFGLGWLFPRLYHEYDPDRPGFRDGSYGSSQSGTQYVSTNRKFSIFTSSQPLSTLSSSSGDTPDQWSQLQSLNFVTSHEMELGRTNTPLQRPQAAQHSSYDATIRRNPFLLRTNLDFPIPFKVPSLFSSSKGNGAKKNRNAQTDVPLEDFLTPRSCRANDPAGIHTRIWSEDEARRLYSNNNNTSDINGEEDARSTPSESGVHINTLFTHETQEISQRRR